MVSLSDTIFEIVADLAGILGAVGPRRGSQNHRCRVRNLKKCEKSGPEPVLKASGRLNEKMMPKMKKNGRLGGVKSLIFDLFYNRSAFLVVFFKFIIVGIRTIPSKCSNSIFL
mgnify:CR=1 FL=1